MAEKIIIAALGLIAILLLIRHFSRLLKGKGCGCGPGSAPPPLQQDLPDLRAKRPAAPPNNQGKPDPKARP